MAPPGPPMSTRSARARKAARAASSSVSGSSSDERLSSSTCSVRPAVVSMDATGSGSVSSGSRASSEWPVTRSLSRTDRVHSPPRRRMRAPVSNAQDDVQIPVRSRSGELTYVRSSGRMSVDRELMGLLQGELTIGHRRVYSDWAQTADDALSLEELELQADLVTGQLDKVDQQAERRLRQRERIRSIRGRLGKVVEGLAECQMKTADMAAAAMAWPEGHGREQVRGLRLTLDHVAKLVLEKAQRLLDQVDQRAYV